MRLTALFLAILLCACGARASETLQTRAQRAYDAADWPQVRALYTLLADRDATQPAYCARMILAAEMQGDTLAASAALQRAMSHGTPLDAVLQHIETDSYALGNGTLYPDMLMRLDRQMPYMRRAWALRLLKVYRFRNNPEGIIEYAGRLVRADMPNAADIYNLLGGAYVQSGRFDEAAAAYRNALAADPDNFDALVALGTLLRHTGDPEAVTFLRRAYTLRPTPALERLLTEPGR